MKPPLMKYLLIVFPLFIISCATMGNSIYSGNQPPKDMEKIDVIKKAYVTSSWIHKPISYMRYMHEGKNEYCVSESLWGQEIKIIGTYVSHAGILEDSPDAIYYVGYSESTGYIYGMKYFVDQELEDITKSEVTDARYEDFRKYYMNIESIAEKDPILKEYQQISLAASKYKPPIGSKIMMKVRIESIHLGTRSIESASIFTIIGNPIYSEPADTIIIHFYTFEGNSIEVASIINSARDCRGLRIWGTIKDDIIDPVVDVDYISFNIADVQEKIIKVEKAK